jgi:hypothetical protein
MTGAVVVSAIAILIQLGILFGLYKAAKPMLEQVSRIAPKAESLVETAQRIAEQNRQNVVEMTAKASEITSKANEIAAKANEMMDSAKVQVARIDTVLSDASERAKSQMDRIEMVLDDTISRVHETVSTVHNGVMKPLREVNGVAVGIRTAFNHLLRGGRPTVAQATSDEEMFI